MLINGVKVLHYHGQNQGQYTRRHLFSVILPSTPTIVSRQESEDAKLEIELSKSYDDDYFFLIKRRGRLRRVRECNLGIIRYPKKCLYS